MSTILDGGTAPTSPPPSSTVDEMYFSTTNGSLSYIGSSGDVITLSDGTTYTVSEDGFYSSENVPVGKHKVKLVETRSDVYVSIGGEALIELHNFPEISTITYFNFYPYISSPNLIKVPTLLPSNLTDVTYLFSEASSFNQDISSWNVSNVTNMGNMFSHANSFNQPLNSWNVSNVTDISGMFLNANSFNQPLNSWNVINVTNMNGVFLNARSFNQDISSWCVINITSEPYYFSTNSPLSWQNKPVWGTCPRGENAT